MLARRTAVERRKRERFPVERGGFVVLTRPNPKAARIVDISTDGLAFHYVRKEGPSQPSEMAIFSADSAVRLFKVPCKTISDSAIDGNRPKSTARRRCGVRFGDLTEGQMSQLEHLIRQYSAGKDV
jgi:hypothetical protein